MKFIMENKESFYKYDDNYGEFIPDFSSKLKDDIVLDSGEGLTDNFNNMNNSFWKYNEDLALNDIKEYIIGTYGGHYCGTDRHKDLQAIDLIASKGLASSFCQSNIIKYSSRYGNKNGRSKRDLLKVIHYAILLLHFDDHYSRVNNGLGEFR